MDIDYVAPTLNPTTPITLGGVVEEIREAYPALNSAVRTLSTGADPEALAEQGEAKQTRYLEGLAEIAYRYAVEGVLPAHYSDNFGHIDDVYVDLTKFTMLARVITEFHGTISPVQLEKLYAMSHIRARLDAAVFGRAPDVGILGSLGQDESFPIEHFTLFEIAVLTQMTEKSVRNATQPNAADRLLTVRLGTRTMVEAHEALRWMMRRRSFTPTSFPRSAKLS